MLTKHKTDYAVYTSYVGRENLHTLVEECKTLQEAMSKVMLYVGKEMVVYVVDWDGNIELKFPS